MSGLVDQEVVEIPGLPDGLRVSYQVVGSLHNRVGRVEAVRGAVVFEALLLADNEAVPERGAVVGVKLSLVSPRNSYVVPFFRPFFKDREPPRTERLPRVSRKAASKKRCEIAVLLRNSYFETDE